MVDGHRIDGPGYVTVLASGEAAATESSEESALWRRRLRHDIRHELGTIIMLASAVACSDDVGPASRTRVQQLLGETRWLDHLLRQLEEDEEAEPVPPPARIRVDELVAEVVSGLRLATPHRVSFLTTRVWAYVDELALWRALRNVLDNACRVANGKIEVRVGVHDGGVQIQVDDDGPGFGSAASAGLGSLGLGIVHDLVTWYGGSVELDRADLGGARVRILLPGAAA